MSHSPAPEKQLGLKEGIWAAIFFTAFILIVLAVIALILRIMDLSRSPEAALPPATSAVTPEVQLQAYPKLDRLKMEKEAHEALSTYGWVNREKQIVRVPVERAMELLLEDNLPVRKEPSSTQTEAKV